MDHVPAGQKILVEGLIPGWKYTARVSAPRKIRGQMMSAIIGMPFDNMAIEPGAKRDLGDLVIKLSE